MKKLTKVGLILIVFGLIVASGVTPLSMYDQYDFRNIDRDGDGNKDTCQHFIDGNWETTFICAFPEAVCDYPTFNQFICTITEDQAEERGIPIVELGESPLEELYCPEMFRCNMNIIEKCSVGEHGKWYPILKCQDWQECWTPDDGSLGICTVDEEKAKEMGLTDCKLGESCFNETIIGNGDDYTETHASWCSTHKFSPECFGENLLFWIPTVLGSVMVVGGGIKK